MTDEKLREHFEANMLDGESLDDCGNAMLSAKEVFSYMSQLIAEQTNVARIQTAMNIWANYEFEITKRRLTSDAVPDGARKMTDKEILSQVIAPQLTDPKEPTQKEQPKN